MGVDARKEAQKRVDRIALFQAELAELEREGALSLTPEQHSRIDAHLAGLLARFRQQFGIDATESAKRVSWGMRVAALLGAAALVAALVLFLHRIWGNLPTGAQVLILAGVPLGLLAGAESAFARRVDPYYVSLWALAAGVSFVVEVNALGALLNLADSPHALLTWGLFAVLVAYAYGIPLLLGAGLSLLCAYSAALVLHAQGYYWVGFPQSAQLLIPGAVLLYCIPWLRQGRGAHDFDFTYRLCGAGLGLGAILMFSTSGDLCCFSLRPRVVEAVYQVLGLLLSAGVVVHGLRVGRSGLVNLGAAAFIVFLFIRLHAWWWDWMPKYLFFLTIGLTAIGLLLVFRRIRARLAEGAVV
jgi:uncharacterized membrane protein